MIPNLRMIDYTPVMPSSNYVPFVAAAIWHLQECGANPFILLYRPVIDRPIAQAISAEVEVPLEVVASDDYRTVKAIVGGCSLVISSRYHGIMNALAQGVSAICIGWSHKYAEMIREAGFEELMVENVADLPNVILLIDKVRTKGLRSGTNDGIQEGKDFAEVFLFRIMGSGGWRAR